MVEKMDVLRRADDDDDEKRGQCLAVLAADPKAEHSKILATTIHVIVLKVSRKKDILLLVLVVMTILEILR